ncbi:hypothetical protein, partial [Adlercreutzia sp.]|uniref:hypothetical protein n=1 Tax=Adlercreutzia sp. TaxID=1872387 RepID=UPI003AB39810
AEVVDQHLPERAQRSAINAFRGRAEVGEQHLPERYCVVELGYRKGHLVVPFQVAGAVAAIGRKWTLPSF